MITQGMTTVMGTIELKASLKENVCLYVPKCVKKNVFLLNICLTKKAILI